MVGLFFFFKTIVSIKSFLGPLLLSIVLALLLFPFVQWLERKKVSRSIAAFTGTLLTFIASIIFLGIVALQINNIIQKWPQIESTMKPKIERFSKYVVSHTPIKQEQVNGYLERNPMSRLFSKDAEGNSGTQFLSSVANMVGVYILCFIYIFFLLLFRSKFKRFLIKAFHKKPQEEVTQTLNRCVQVVKGYMIGKFKLIGLLVVLYTIGLGISGVTNFILVSVLAAILTFIPYVGNMIGMGLALVFGYLIQGDISILIGILATFTLVQFIESYILQPYVIGSEVSLNPFIIILSIIIGNMVWGILGMLLAIPLTGILNVIFFEIKVTKPLAYLLDKKDN